MLGLQMHDLVPDFYVGPGDPSPGPFASAANILPMNIYSKPIIVCWVQYPVLMHKYGVLCYNIHVNNMSTALYIDRFFVFSTPRILYSGYSVIHDEFLNL